MERSITALVIFIVVFISGASAWSAMLDKQSDVFSNWKLSGVFEYYPSGSQLRMLKADLPPDFDYKPFREAVGIWAVLANPSDGSTSAAFGYHTYAQLIESVTITYSIGGNGTITLKRDLGDNATLYVIDGRHEAVDKLMTTTIPLDPISGFILEAVVHEKPDFVFIDRILANFMEATTPPTTPRSTRTTKVPPTPTADPIISLAPSSSSTSSMVPVLVTFLIKCVFS